MMKIVTSSRQIIKSRQNICTRVLQQQPRQFKSRSHLRKSNTKIQANSSTEFAEVFKSELDFEENNPDAAEYPEPVPPSYILQVQKGQANVVLTREFEGEHIKIEANLSDRYENQVELDEDDDEEDLFVQFDFEITIRKNSSPDTELFIECTGEDGRLGIRNVQFRKIKEKQDQNDNEYYGPIFDDLDEQMATATFAYLGARGIDEAMIEYLDMLLTWKDEEEYKNWLQQGCEFLST
eukprot:TRINITY_DN448_c0_g1_i14.p1 TRINITY_DN448_c0_g1~~TRINITY_DN448_c0_g1_i14.p1  ORF type:complete len:273 (-),score=35.38 TRINITY_DN448_c0_g1_i14:477-1187(-)